MGFLFIRLTLAMALDQIWQTNLSPQGKVSTKYYRMNMSIFVTNYIDLPSFQTLAGIMKYFSIHQDTICYKIAIISPDI